MRKTVNILISGNGGHYFELVKLYESLRNESTFCNCHDFIVLTSSDSRKIDLQHVSLREIRSKNSWWKSLMVFPLAILINIYSFFLLALRYRVNSIISTGPGTSIVPIVLGKTILNAKIVHVETMCKFQDLTLSGKIIKNFSDLFIVQNEELSEKYINEVTYGGRL